MRECDDLDNNLGFELIGWWVTYTVVRQMPQNPPSKEHCCASGGVGACPTVDENAGATVVELRAFGEGVEADGGVVASPTHSEFVHLSFAPQHV